MTYFDETGFADDEPVDIAVVGMGPDFGTFESLRRAWQSKTRPAHGRHRHAPAHPVPARRRARAPARTRRVVLVVNQAHHSGRGHLTLDVADSLSELENPPRIVSAFAAWAAPTSPRATWEAMLDEARDALDGAAAAPTSIFHDGSAL